MKLYNGFIILILFIIFIIIVSCGKDTPVTPSETRKGSITGSIQAFSYNYREASRDSSIMYKDILNDITVFLVKDGKDVGSVKSFQGDYTFDSVTIGNYQARIQITPDIALTTPIKPVTDKALSFFDDIKFIDYSNHSDILMIGFLMNNPFPNTGCDVYYTVSDNNMNCTLDIFNIKGEKMAPTQSFKPDTTESKRTIGAGLAQGIYFILLKSGNNISYMCIERKD